MKPVVEDVNEEEEEEYEEEEVVEITSKKPVEEKFSAPKVTPSYSNIRRSRPVASTR